MSTQRYRFDLSSSSSLNNVFLFLEDQADHVRLTFSHVATRWKGEVSLDVQGSLDYRLVVLGSSQITWEAKLTNITQELNQKKVWADKGRCGEKYANKSVRQGSVEPTGNVLSV